MYLYLKTFCDNNDKKCQNICILLLKNNLDFIKLYSNLFNLYHVSSKFNKFHSQ